jgi:hypothetical protein
MIKANHWQDPLNAVLGVAVLVSPWAFGYELAQQAMANAVIVGAMLFAISIGASVIGRPWVEWAIILLGCWLVVAPWSLDFRHEDATATAVGFGTVVLALGLWSLVDTVRKHAPWRTPKLR